MGDIGHDYECWVYPLKWGQTVADQDWTPLHFHRLLGSDFVAECCAGGMAGRAVLGTALLLWAEAMKQDPGGTLPDSDIALARLAGFGPDIEGWRAVRPLALHGWSACMIGHEDGMAEPSARLGHPVVARNALFAWNRKDGRKKGREAAHLSNVKWKVRQKMADLRKPQRLIDDDILVTTVARWLVRAGLQVSRENVASGLAVAGVPSVIAGGREGGATG